MYKNMIRNTIIIALLVYAAVLFYFTSVNVQYYTPEQTAINYAFIFISTLTAIGIYVSGGKRTK